MFFVWVLTLILASVGIHDAILLANWFGEHTVLTILLLLFFA